jgi:hypothetical protein
MGETRSGRQRPRHPAARDLARPSPTPGRAAAPDAVDRGAVRAQHRRGARRGERQARVLVRVPACSGSGGRTCRRTAPPAPPCTSRRSPGTQPGLGEERVVGGREHLGHAARLDPRQGVGHRHQHALVHDASSAWPPPPTIPSPGRPRRRSAPRRRGPSRDPRRPAPGPGCPAAEPGGAGVAHRRAAACMSAPLSPAACGCGPAPRRRRAPGSGCSGSALITFIRCPATWHEQRIRCSWNRGPVMSWAKIPAGRARGRATPFARRPPPAPRARSPTSGRASARRARSRSARRAAW